MDQLTLNHALDQLTLIKPGFNKEILVSVKL